MTWNIDRWCGLEHFSYVNHITVIVFYFLVIIFLSILLFSLSPKTIVLRSNISCWERYRYIKDSNYREGHAWSAFHIKTTFLITYSPPPPYTIQLFLLRYSHSLKRKKISDIIWVIDLCSSFNVDCERAIEEPSLAKWSAVHKFYYIEKNYERSVLLMLSLKKFWPLSDVIIHCMMLQLPVSGGIKNVGSYILNINYRWLIFFKQLICTINVKASFGTCFLHFCSPLFVIST